MKKAQIKMFESVAVLVVFSFLMIFGINFYFGIQKESIRREISRANQLQTFTMGQKAAFLPELDCALAGIQQEACIDLTKLNAFAAKLQESETFDIYFPVFGWSTVTVTQIYPAADVISLWDNPLPDYSRADKVQVPIVITNQSTGEGAFGYIEVTRYAE